MIAIVGRVGSSARVLSLLFVVLAWRGDGAPNRRLWGTLVPGPYPVGFARSWQLDRDRQYAPEFRAETAGPGPAPECPRPILVNLWYPARESGAAPMRYRDYLEIGSDNPLIAPFARRLDAFTRRTIAEEYRKAQQLIASGAKPTASERARKMIANSLKKAEGK